MRCFTRRAALVGLAAGAIAAPALAQELTPGEAQFRIRQLVARHKDWRGPAYDSLQSIHQRFNVGRAGADQPAPGARWMDRDGRFREQETDAGQLRVRSVGPDGVWGDADWKPADPKVEAERARRYAVLVFGDAYSGRGGASLSLAGTAEQWDATWTVLRVSFGDADTYEALMDPDHGMLCGYRITEGGAKRTVLFGDWRLVDGVRMPFIELLLGSAEYRFGSIELNKSFDQALFRPPAP